MFFFQLRKGEKRTFLFIFFAAVVAGTAVVADLPLFASRVRCSCSRLLSLVRAIGIIDARALLVRGRPSSFLCLGGNQGWGASVGFFFFFPANEQDLALLRVAFRGRRPGGGPAAIWCSLCAERCSLSVESPPFNTTGSIRSSSRRSWGSCSFARALRRRVEAVGTSLLSCFFLRLANQTQGETDEGEKSLSLSNSDPAFFVPPSPPFLGLASPI